MKHNASGAGAGDEAHPQQFWFIIIWGKISKHLGKEVPTF